MAIDDRPDLLARRPRRRGISRQDIALILVVVAAVGMLVVLLWVYQGSNPKPMTGPGTFSDASNTVRFGILADWEVIHDDSNTRVEHVKDALPMYRVGVRNNEQMNLVVNWDCEILRERSRDIAQGISPWNATVTFASIPCADDPTIPAYGRLYVTLNDGSERKGVIVYAPVSGTHWIVTFTGPFDDDAPPEVVEAMTHSVTSAVIIQ
ncbi:MAG: hypothetical protein JW966_11470 [Anaerolineae bacterium]|nr:hypothetical protein [Anaerolineae bacterium]